MNNASLAPGQDHYSRWSVNIKSHWSTAYLMNRYKEYMYRKKNPKNPWLTQDAIKILASIIKPSDSILEFGSGRSTMWFAERAAHITSMESNPDWFKVVQQNLVSYQSQVKLILIEESPVWLKKYSEAIKQIAPGTIDICLVDGGPRALSALASLRTLKSGGYMVIDNANWFFPTHSKSPSSIRTWEEVDPLFKEFYEQVKNWRVIWTSNGVTDTAIYIKP
ncbi:MAG TPA: hypothetical protein VM012_11380 [Flavitalea sp.]|nr:hypothetical protein [Flavitalea sp.]